MSRAKNGIAAGSRDKFSEMLLEYAAPLLDDAESADEVRFSLGLAIMIWNAFLIPEEQRKTVEEDILSIMTPTGDAQEHVVALNLYRRMFSRRRDLFSRATRFVADFEVSEDPHGRIEVKVVCAGAPSGASKQAPVLAEALSAK